MPHNFHFYSREKKLSCNKFHIFFPSLSDTNSQDIGSDSLARERTCARNVIVESYSRLLPGIQRKLAFGPETGVDRTKMIRREGTKNKMFFLVNVSQDGRAMNFLNTPSRSKVIWNKGMKEGKCSKMFWPRNEISKIEIKNQVRYSNTKKYYWFEDCIEDCITASCDTILQASDIFCIAIEQTEDNKCIIQ